MWAGLYAIHSSKHVPMDFITNYRISTIHYDCIEYVVGDSTSSVDPFDNMISPT